MGNFSACLVVQFLVPFLRAIGSSRISSVPILSADSSRMGEFEMKGEELP